MFGVKLFHVSEISVVLLGQCVAYLVSLLTFQYLVVVQASLPSQKETFP